MGKKLILATAGSGKTKYLIDRLSTSYNTLIITYTNNNFENIKNRIISVDEELFNSTIIMTYYSFLYNFCYKPFLADEYMFSGIDYKRYKFDYKTKSSIEFYVKNNKLYHNRIFLFLQESKT